MRSSKSRSRSKSNRPRTIGNIVNRVFDSSGPEGKVRGTPQQIIEKYLILARDAQLSNDRVAAENFLQHAEHYTRMLGEAQRELAAEQDHRRDGGQNGGQNGNQNGYAQIGGYRERNPRDEMQDPVPAPRLSAVIDLADDSEDSGLVETPEMRPRPEMPRSEPPRSELPRSEPPRGDFRERGPQPDRRDDRPRFQPQDRRPPPRPSEAGAPPIAAEAPQPVLSPMMPSFAPPEPAAPETPAPKPAMSRRPRAPRKPKAGDDGPGGDGPAEAAE
jgi:hypothetical protein